MRKFLPLKLALLMAAPLVIGAVAQPARAMVEYQPRMVSALNNLEDARECLEAATSDKGGHRRKALRLIGDARSAVRDGIRFDSTHRGDREREREGGREIERRRSIFDRDDDLRGHRREAQPMMRAAKRQLEDAKRDLERADADKGGYRRRALDKIRDAIDEVEKGMRFDDRDRDRDRRP